MKTKRSALVLLVACVLLSVTHEALAFYNPQTGRWLSRDPVDERGGENLSSFSANNAIDFWDLNGLTAIEFWSWGKAYFDGPWWPGQVSYKKSESGFKRSSDAYFNAVGIEVVKCPSGICNSTDDGGENSSNIKAFVINRCKDSIRVACTCKIHWFGINYSPGRNGRKGFLVKGRVLGHSFTKEYLSKAQPDGSYVAAGRGDFSKEGTISLAPGASEQLYRGHDEITYAPQNPGAGFTEMMTGECSCEVLK